MTLNTDRRTPYPPQWLGSWAGRVVFTAVAVGWMGLIFYLSSQSPEELPAQDALSWLGEVRNIVGHLALFGVLAGMLTAVLWSWFLGPINAFRWPLFAIGAASLYGVLDEYHQSLVPLRDAALSDILVDLIGAVIGAGAITTGAYIVRGHWPKSI